MADLVVKKKKKSIKIFPIVNFFIFFIISIFIMIPLWKILVDSFDSRAAYGMSLIPNEFTINGYKVILTTKALYQPFLISVVTTIAGTIFGLILSTLGAYALIQFKMPGRGIFAYLLLFTMIFNGGMIPEYLNLVDLGIINTLWAVILPSSINVFNLVLMRNFFEGIPGSLFESASIDGCSPLGTFFKIVLPLSKAALASIGLMFGVASWNNYTSFKIYITKRSLYNFQLMLRNMIMDSDTPSTAESVSQNTLHNAAIIVAIIPFMIIYPFCQDYFVHGVNVGAVKE